MTRVSTYDTLFLFKENEAMLVSSGRNISVQDFYRLIIKSWQKTLAGGDNLNFSYEMPMMRGWLLCRAAICHDDRLRLDFARFLPVQVWERTIYIKGENRQIDGELFLKEATNWLTICGEQLFSILIDFGLEAGIIMRTETPAAVPGTFFPHGC